VTLRESVSGEPVRGASIRIQDPIRLGPVPAVASATTDSAGTAQVRVPDEHLWIGKFCHNDFEYTFVFSVKSVQRGAYEREAAHAEGCAAITVVLESPPK